MNDPLDKDFDALVDIVCKHYRVPKELVLSKSRRRRYANARQIIGAIWNCAGNTLNETCERLPWTSHQSVITARKKVVEMSANPFHAVKLERIEKEIAEKMPFMLDSKELEY